MPLPFPLPALSPAHAALSPHHRELGAALARQVSAALSAALELPVTLEGRPLPARPAPGLGCATLTLALEALPAHAAIEVDASLLARALARLAGAAPGPCPAELAAGCGETLLLQALTLVALRAVDGGRLPALAPRLLLQPPPGGAGPRANQLCLELELAVGSERGRGRLFLPEEALRALDGRETADGGASRLEGLCLPASLRTAFVSLGRDELAALVPGDVLVVDPGPEVRASDAELVFPGGLTARGRRLEGELLVEEIGMTEPQASYPLVLGVEIARVTVRLGELARLAPGASLPLGVPADGAVVLRAGEHAVARGHLVDLDGALGVRLTQVGDAP